MAAIDYSTEQWNEISDGIDKLLDLEAKQPRKVITSKEFGILEQLLIRIESLTGHKAPLAKRLFPYKRPAPQMTKRK